MNRFPLWKNILVVVILLIAGLYAVPNVFDQDPSIEISVTKRGESVDAKEDTPQKVRTLLEPAGLAPKAIEALERDKTPRWLVRFRKSEDQLHAKDILEERLGEGFNVALTLAADIPRWLTWIDARPMYLGLDLRGGIHVLIDVDTDAAVAKTLDRYAEDARAQLRKEKVRYQSVTRESEGLEVKFQDLDALNQADKILNRELHSLLMTRQEQGGNLVLRLKLPPVEQTSVKKLAVEQNITTLRNRVNALGIAEPIIQQQGERRIVVQLPGVQDPSRVKELLGATATLEYRLVDTEHTPEDALAGRVPPASKLYKDRKGRPVLLKKNVIVTGDQITNASSGFDQRGGSPAVFISLDPQGARRMLTMTQENVGKPMAVVFIENRTLTRQVDGKPVKRKVTVEEVISVANILEPFGPRFQTTGLENTEEARNLALLLRAGALAAPIEIVEERTIGPSLGQDNIDKGVRSAIGGLIVVALYMFFKYRLFGLLANLGLIANLMMLLALLSFLQATLTLPGIAGIVLTLGMAVDANILINERILEELRLGNTPQASIHAGYERAFTAILDSNITTLIAGITLFSFGSGPVKGFAVVLALGILTSMLSAITVTRAMVNALYGGRRLERLPI
ncbi:Sec translocon accessory complex subunit SecD [Gammaproteobacteria bacterium]